MNVFPLFIFALILFFTTGCVHRRCETPPQPTPNAVAKTDLIVATARAAVLEKYPEIKDLNLISATHHLAGGFADEINVRFELPDVAVGTGPVGPKSSRKKGYHVDVRMDAWGKIISVNKSDFQTFEYTKPAKKRTGDAELPAILPSAQKESPGIDAATPKGLISVFFGERLPDGSLRRTRKITWKPGNKYGWDVTVFAKEPSIKVKEILRLPAPATFIEKTKTTSALIKNRSDKISNDGQALEKEFTLNTSKPVKYGQTFTILDTDPKGAHRFQLFINGTLASDVEFEVAD